MGRRADSARSDGQTLRAEIRAHGLRNSLLIAIAPTATIASIAGCYECIEPQISNLFKRETLSGDFLQINGYLIEELEATGPCGPRKFAMPSNSPTARCRISQALPAELKAIYRTAWELPMKALIEMAAERGAFIDQSQSLNLFMANPNIGQLSSMYMYAWKAGLKTTYYLRSRPATRIAKTTVSERNRTHRRSWMRSPARWKTPNPARPASEPPARPGLQPDPAPDALPQVLRNVPRCHQEHLERGGDRLSDRPGPSAAAHESRRPASDRAAGGVLRHRRLHRRQQCRVEPVQAHQRTRGADVSVAPALRRGACTCSST